MHSEATVRQIKEVARHFEPFKIQVIGRAGNMVADFLAKSCEIIKEEVRIIETPNVYTRNLLADDLVTAFIV